MNDRPDTDESAVDLETFHEWVEETAAAEGTSPDAIIQQLMSTYWILNELTETLEETPYAHLIEEAPSEAAERPDEEATDSEIVDVIEAIAELNAGSEASERSAGRRIDPGLIEVIEALQRNSESTGSDATFTYVTSQLDRIRDTVGDLERDLDRIHNRLDDVEADASAEVDGVADRLETLEENTATLREAVEETDERLDREVADLRGTVEPLEEAVAGKADRESLADLASLTDDRVEETQARVDNLEETFDAAYADIKQILAYLLDATAAHEAVREVLVDVHDSELSDVIDAYRETERLDELKQAASRQGILTAVCEACDESFRVGLLAEPRCPHCHEPIDRFETESKLWRRTHYAIPGRQPLDDSTPSVRERVEDAVRTAEHSQPNAENHEPN